LIAPQFLQTLPAREMKCGIGELVKYAALNVDIFQALQSADSLNDEAFLISLIRTSIAHKISVVEQDEKESGERKSLNVGHTTGHAIELFYQLSHGESVLYGMWIETKIAMDKGICSTQYGEKLLRIVERALRLQPNASVDLQSIAKALHFAKADKKNHEDGKICLSVAKAAGVWTPLALEYDDYCASVLQAVSKFGV
jgi:3-dehydroquinate synthetase